MLGQCRDHSILGLFFNLITILSKQINRGFIYSSIYHNLNRYNVMCNFPFIGHSKYEIFLTWYVYNIWKTNLIFHIFSILFYSNQTYCTSEINYVKKKHVHVYVLIWQLTYFCRRVYVHEFLFKKLFEIFYFDQNYIQLRPILLRHQFSK